MEVTMRWEFIVALFIAIPIILFPVAYIWYLNLGGIYTAIKEARERRLAGKERGVELANAGQPTVIAPTGESGIKTGLVKK